ncbi:hypothetical protein LV828_22830, partial [[Clostridium] innocuum]|uniref:hypothetical protein n=1 Tax=Clostridium innocuum TaxID=1522 RepID=UPI001F581B27
SQSSQSTVKMNGAFHAPPLTAPPVFANGQSRRESPKMASRPFLRTDKSDLLKNPNPQRGRK